MFKANTIHVWCIYLHLVDFCMVNVCKYTSSMDTMEDCYFGCFRFISNLGGCLGLMTGQPIWVFGIAIIDS